MNKESLWKLRKEILENDKSITKKDLLNIISKNMNKKS